MTKYFVDSNNDYIGGFDGATPPAGSIEVPFPPKDARQKWNGSDWDEVVLPKEENVQVALDKAGYDLDKRVSALEAYILKNDKAAAEAIQAVKDAVPDSVVVSP